RTTRVVARVTSPPRRAPAAGAGVVWTCRPTPPTSTTSCSSPTCRAVPRTEGIPDGSIRGRCPGWPAGDARESLGSPADRGDLGAGRAGATTRGVGGVQLLQAVAGATGGAGRLGRPEEGALARGLAQPRSRLPPPEMADGQREGVGSVRGPGWGVEPEHPGDHRGDLRLVGTSVAGHRGLHLSGRVQRQREPEARGREHG